MQSLSCSFVVLISALQGLAACPGKVMDSRGEMEVVRSTKGSAAGEVSVHVVTSESTVQGTHLPTTAFIIPGTWGSPRAAALIAHTPCVAVLLTNLGRQSQAAAAILEVLCGYPTSLGVFVVL